VGVNSRRFGDLIRGRDCFIAGQHRWLLTRGEQIVEAFAIADVPYLEFDGKACFDRGLQRGNETASDVGLRWSVGIECPAKRLCFEFLRGGEASLVCADAAAGNCGDRRIEARDNVGLEVALDDTDDIDGTFHPERHVRWRARAVAAVLRTRKREILVTVLWS